MSDPKPAKTGRPPNYTEAQVLKGIELVEQSGKVPGGDTVKKAMCEALGVTLGISAQSLDREVKRLLEEREQERLDRLIAALPATSRAAVQKIGASVATAVLGHMAEEYDQLRSAAHQTVAEMKEDLACQRVRIRDLEACVEEKDGQIAALETEKGDLEGQLEAAMAKIASLEDRITGYENEGDLRTQFFEMMKEALVQQPPAAGSTAA